MDFKKTLTLFSLLILIFTTSFVFAENITLEDNSFEVPQGYVIENSSDVSAKLVRQNNSNYTVFISVGDFSDSQNAQQSREISGFKFLADENYTTDNNISVNRQNYMKNESYYSFYSFELGNSSYLIGYTFPVHDELDSHNNPVDDMIEKIK